MLATSIQEKPWFSCSKSARTNVIDVKALALCDRGLYYLSKQASLTLLSRPKLFAEDSHSWFATLELIRTSTIKLV